MTPEIESAFAHLLDPRCRLRAADRRVELERLREMVRAAIARQQLNPLPHPQSLYQQYSTWEWSPPNDRGMRVPGGAAV